MSVVYSGDKITFADSSVQSSAPIGFKNRIINGDFRIDQRNSGASVTPTNDSYTLDRWQAYASAASKFTIQQNAGSVTPPVGFINYLGVTSSSAYSVTSSDNFGVVQNIEGLNCADLWWGTANAKTITISFWVRSSLTGTFGGALRNSAGNRSYPFTYTITTANTWEYETITIAGDTTGTWLTNNGKGINVIFGLGAGTTYSGTAGTWAAADYRSATGATSVVGTNGATWYVAGVQFEVGSTASAFEVRDYGRELIMCQRYYQIAQSTQGASTSTDETTFVCTTPLWTPMRANPTATLASGAQIHKPNVAFINISSISSGPSATGGSYTVYTIPSGYGTQFSGQVMSGLKLSAEL